MQSEPASRSWVKLQGTSGNGVLCRPDARGRLQEKKKKKKSNLRFKVVGVKNNLSLKVWEIRISVLLLLLYVLVQAS